MEVDRDTQRQIEIETKTVETKTETDANRLTKIEIERVRLITDRWTGRLDIEGKRQKGKTDK